jgi:ABC-type sugar transport system substrate-binding protein
MEGFARERNAAELRWHLINARAAGFRDTIAGKKGVAKLAGDGGWTEIAGCPLFTNDQTYLANKQMADVFTKNPKLDAFTLVGGWAQFGPQAYAQVTDQVMPKLKSKELIVIAGDTLPPQLDALKNGRSHAQIGERELTVIAAAVIGGANLAGGAGTAFSAVVAAALIEVIRNSLTLLGVSTFWQGTFVGSFIVVAALFDRLRSRGSDQ